MKENHISDRSDHLLTVEKYMNEHSLINEFHSAYDHALITGLHDLNQSIERIKEEIERKNIAVKNVHTDHEKRLLKLEVKGLLEHLAHEHVLLTPVIVEKTINWMHEHISTKNTTRKNEETIDFQHLTNKNNNAWLLPPKIKRLFKSAVKNRLYDIHKAFYSEMKSMQSDIIFAREQRRLEESHHSQNSDSLKSTPVNKLEETSIWYQKIKKRLIHVLSEQHAKISKLLHGVEAGLYSSHSQHHL